MTDEAVRTRTTPRPPLLVAGDDDRYARDIDAVARHAARSYDEAGAAGKVTAVVRPGGHALDTTRRDILTDWVAGVASELA